MAKLLLIDVYAEKFDDKVKCVQCNDLDDYYKYLRVDCFDIAHRKVGNKYFDIFVDDCGLLKDDPIVSAIRWENDDHERYEPMLVGNLIIANHDNVGNTTSLSKEDAEIIMDNILMAESKNLASGETTIRPILVCDY